MLNRFKRDSQLVISVRKNLKRKRKGWKETSDSRKKKEGTRERERERSSQPWNSLAAWRLWWTRSLTSLPSRPPTCPSRCIRIIRSRRNRSALTYIYVRHMCVFVLRQTSPPSLLPPLLRATFRPLSPPLSHSSILPPSVIQTLPTRSTLFTHAIKKERPKCWRGEWRAGRGRRLVDNDYSVGRSGFTISRSNSCSVFSTLASIVLPILHASSFLSLSLSLCFSLESLIVIHADRSGSKDNSRYGRLWPWPSSTSLSLSLSFARSLARSLTFSSFPFALISLLVFRPWRCLGVSGLEIGPGRADRRSLLGLSSGRGLIGRRLTRGTRCTAAATLLVHHLVRLAG